MQSSMQKNNNKIKNLKILPPDSLLSNSAAMASEISRLQQELRDAKDSLLLTQQENLRLKGALKAPEHPQNTLQHYSKLDNSLPAVATIQSISEERKNSDCSERVLVGSEGGLNFAQNASAASSSMLSKFKIRTNITDVGNKTAPGVTDGKSEEKKSAKSKVGKNIISTSTLTRLGSFTTNKSKFSMKRSSSQPREKNWV